MIPGRLGATEPQGISFASRPGESSPGDPSTQSGEPELERVTRHAGARDSLESLFLKLGIGGAERPLWLRSLRRHSPLKRLVQGSEVRFYFASLGAGNRPKKELRVIEAELDADRLLRWKREGNTVVFRQLEIPYQVESGSFAWVVEGSIFEDGVRAGLEPDLLMQLREIFKDEIDFEQGIEKGDALKLVYDKRTREDNSAKPRFKILAAEVVTRGQHYHALYFEQEMGKGNYYDLEGESLLRAFLRFPLEFKQLSSPFSDSRFHPMRKVHLPHRAVDFAAPRGTPVRAIGNGKVVHAGWKSGGLGRVVEIQHGGGFTSRYAHLKSYALGIRKGAAVTKGQVIGHVGATGRTTGPHLHLEVYKDRQQVDIMTVDLPPVERIKPAFRPVFELTKRLFLHELAALSDS
jgi:murein DD-endopeptidase MepM/ murein hydrolase activator NlpD